MEKVTFSKDFFGRVFMYVYDERNTIKNIYVFKSEKEAKEFVKELNKLQAMKKQI